ncbi:ribose-phosphate pyrophosphokinase [Dictyobacter formicarum]|uniref:Ribose-phosphate pyrophosphokinase n=1 Tax=Dictyobacter formicarum TaxID=2778368 RepID=A0ABQ3VMJ0_9CHLR|nr:ribose-phosphate pyrophosphokinase [Dictyobacter formicarum]GHO86583.1 ribose-phosphate pyrophosphokinase [Dictyobacter formicarum]
MDDLSIFSGNANRPLAAAICRHLRIPLGDADVFQFSNENIFVKINENVRGRDVFVIQPFSTPVNRSIMELLIMLDALKRASAARITAVIPYYAYGRTDKKDQPRVPITARLIADCITVAGADRVLTMDMHAGQIQGFFNIPVDELTAQITQARYFVDKDLQNFTVVSADEGFAKKARKLADRLDAPLAIVEKRRLGNNGMTEAMGIIGNVEGRNVLIVDDEIDTAGSLTQAVRVVHEGGALDIYCCVTHGIFSGSALERLRKAPIKEIVITDSIPSPEPELLPNLTVLSVAELIAGTISRIHDGRSVSELFW